jgi:DNA invertase Pin-like site-specific DNA recombinase
MTKKLDIYTRVSRLSDARMQSVADQETDCRALVAEAGAEVGEVFSDPGRSAWRKGVRRPGWEALMARIESGASDGFIVFDLSRFTRRPMEGERLIEAAESGLTVLDSQKNFDLTTADGKSEFRDKMKMAAYQSDVTSLTSSRSKRLRAKRGNPNGSHRAFGFEDDGVTVREEEAAVLREMAERFLAGESQDSLIRDLNARDVLTSYDKPWTRAGFRQVMLRPRNAGLVVYRGEPVAEFRDSKGQPVETAWDRDTYDLVVAAYAARKPGRPISGRYTCSGIARCGHCGHSLTGRPRSNMSPYPDGEVRREYWCSTSTGGCRRIAIDQRALDDWAGEFVIRTLSDQEQIDAFERASRERAVRREQLQASLASIGQIKIDFLAEAGRKRWSMAEISAYCDSLDQQQEAIREELLDLAAQEPGPLPPGARTLPARDLAWVDWLARWDEGTSVERRAMLLRALDGRKIVVGPAKGAAGRVSVV